MITNQVYDLTDRLRSYELVAAMELPAASSSSAA